MSLVSWFNSKQHEMEQVLHDAQALRARYGCEAERWCEAALTGRIDGEQRRLLKQLRRALAHIPAATV